jgi:hypothetical protein
VLPAGRGEQLLDAWKADYERRLSLRSGSFGAGDKNGGRRGRGRGRSRGHNRG